MASNPLAQFGSFLQSAPAYTDYHYDGLEYRWKFFVFRPALFQTEAYIICALALYMLTFFYGKSTNNKKANAWFDAHQSTLETQFTKPSELGLTADGNSDFFNFSTGRRAVASLHTVFTLRPRHDLLQMLFQFAYGLYDLNYKPTDDVILDFKLHSSTTAPGGVFAIVNKSELRDIKSTRWDLTFTKATEHAALHPTLSIMSEFPDITDNMLKTHGNFELVKLLNDPALLPYFKSLSVTDQPSERPETPLKPDEREKHVIVVFSCPTAGHAADTVAFVNSLFAFIDIVDTKIGPALRPETKTKLKKVREDFDKQLKTEADAEKKEEAAEEKRAARRREEEARIAKLSAAEQQKIIERDRKRAMRKTQGKIARK